MFKDSTVTERGFTGNPNALEQYSGKFKKKVKEEQMRKQGNPNRLFVVSMYG